MAFKIRTKKQSRKYYTLGILTTLSELMEEAYTNKRIHAYAAMTTLFFNVKRKNRFESRTII